MESIKDIFIGTIGATNIAVGGYSMTTLDTPDWVGWFFVISGLVIIVLIWAPITARSSLRIMSERALFMPKWPRLQKRINWRANKPYLGGGSVRDYYLAKDGNVVHCNIFFQFSMISRYYYGETELCYDDMRIYIKQNKGGSVYFYNFLFRPYEGKTNCTIGPANWVNEHLIFCWDGIGSEEKFAPNLDFEYSWKITGFKAKLIGPDGQTTGNLPDIRGKKFGRRI